MKFWVWELLGALIEEPSQKWTLIRCTDGGKVKAGIHEEWKPSDVSNMQEKEESICGTYEKEVKSSHNGLQCDLGYVTGCSTDSMHT